MGKIACTFNNRKSRISKIIAITYLSPRILMGHKGSCFGSVKVVSYASTNMAFFGAPIIRGSQIHMYMENLFQVQTPGLYFQKFRFRRPQEFAFQTSAPGDLRITLWETLPHHKFFFFTF